MDKKAQAPEKVIFLFLGLFAYIAMFMALSWIFGKYALAPVITSEDIYIDIYKHRFLDSPDCFAYQDPETGNSYSGIIDKSKFTEERLNNCYMENQESVYEFALTLDEGEPIRTKEFVLTKRRVGPLFVLVYDDGKISKGSLMISVQGVPSG